MMKNILLVNGNPKKSSFTQQLNNTYEIEAREHANVRRFDLSAMAFNPSLVNGYDAIQPLEQCLLDFQDAVSWANHIVIIAPIWWGGCLVN